MFPESVVKREWVVALMEARRLLIRSLRQFDRGDYERLGTSGACDAAALFLYSTLLKHAPEATPVIHFGCYGCGRTSHYWVQIKDDGTTWDLDVSADQFGAPRLACAPHFPDLPVYIDPVPVDASFLTMWKRLSQINEGDPPPQVRLERTVELFTRKTP